MSNPPLPSCLARQTLRQWFTTPLGRELAYLEQHLLRDELSQVFGYYLVQLGCLGWGDLPLTGSRVRKSLALDPDSGLPGRSGTVFARLDQLPIASDSVDAVLLPHTLEFEDDPHQVLREVDRILIPEGRLLLLAFNPWSLMGLGRALARGNKAPWNGHFLSQARINDWLRLMGFEVENTHHLLFRPPLQRTGLLHRLGFLERLGERWWPLLGGVYMLSARKRVSTLTPIRPHWRPQPAPLSPGWVEPTARRRAA